MDQICPILCDNWETELYTYPLPIQNSFGMAENVKIPQEKFSFFQWCATNQAFFSEWICYPYLNNYVFSHFPRRFTTFRFDRYLLIWKSALSLGVKSSKQWTTLFLASSAHLLITPFEIYPDFGSKHFIFGDTFPNDVLTRKSLAWKSLETWHKGQIFLEPEFIAGFQIFVLILNVHSDQYYVFL